MGNLNDKLIREAYKGLIKTNDEAGITGTPKVLQDGEGNNLPVAVSTTGMTYSGVQDFSGATVLGISGGGGGTAGSSGTSGTSGTSGGGGGLENYTGYPWYANVQGYGPTYAHVSQNINSEVFWSAAIDQNANTAIFGKLLVEPGVEITTFINPFLSVLDNDTYELAIYDTHPNGAPRDKVFTTTVSVLGGSGDQYVETVVSFTPTQNRYWFALQSELAGASKIGMFPRNAFQNTYFTYGAWGSSPVGLLAVNSLYYNSGDLPASLASDQTYGHRDEGVVLLYKH